MFERIDIGDGDAALQMTGDVLHVLLCLAVDVARQVEVELVVLDLGEGHHACVLRDVESLVENVHDLVDIHIAQAVLGAVLHEATAGVDHEDARAGLGVFLVDDHDAGRDAGTVKEVSGQTDDAFDIALTDKIAPDIGLGIAAKQHAVGQDAGALASALERRDEVEEEGVIAILGRRNTVLEALVGVIGRIKATGPGFGRKVGIGDGEVERLEAVGAVREVRGGQGVALPQYGDFVAVQDHVHSRQRPGDVVHLLAIDADAVRRLVGGFEQQRARATSGIVDGLVRAGIGADTDHLRYDARDLGRGVELPFALPGLGGEMAHQVLVGVAQQVVSLGPIGAEVEAIKDGDQLGEPVLHLFAAAELGFIVEIGLVNDPLEVVSLGESADDFVDLVANLLVALELQHVGKAAPGGHIEERIGLVRHVLHEQQSQDVILVLRGIHAAAQLVAALPQ